MIAPHGRLCCHGYLWPLSWAGSTQYLYICRFPASWCLRCGSGFTVTVYAQLNPKYRAGNLSSVHAAGPYRLFGTPVQASMTPPLPFGCYMFQNQYLVNGPKFRCPSKCSLAPSDHSCSDLCVSSRLSLEKLSPGWPSPSSMP